MKKDTNTARMPVVFVGHGSPMNAIEDNAVTRTWQKLGKDISKPRAILVVSAHWETDGTQVFVDPEPETIHDFYGFPQELNSFQYPSPGEPQIAREVVAMLSSVGAIGTEDWGLDHGAWSVLCRMYPGADVPVFQVSLDRNLSLKEHYQIGRLLSPLREKGVLILGSGNIVHNLGEMDPRINAEPASWAIEFDARIKQFLLERNSAGLIHLEQMKLPLLHSALPTLEHYLPLLYVAGASQEEDTLRFPVEAFHYSSLSMRSILFR